MTTFTRRAVLGAGAVGARWRDARAGRLARTAYFGANATRLAEVRASYDPDGFFTQPQDL